MRVKLPSPAVTGIGSLPFIHAEEAVHFVERWSPEIPFWPQLPKLGRTETIVLQFLAPSLTSKIDTSKPDQLTIERGQLQEFVSELGRSTGELNQRSTEGFFALTSALRAGRFPNSVALKGQIVGPLTQASSLTVSGKPMLADPAVVSLVTGYLARSARWQIEQLQQARPGTPIIVIVDEPVLTIVTRPRFMASRQQLLSDINTLLKAIRQAGAIAGVHCCADRPLTELAELDADIYSFDAYSHLESLMTTETGKHLLARDCILALGLVPVVAHANDYPADFSMAVAEYFARTAGQSVKSLLPRLLITTSCGLGLSQPAVAERAFDHCRQVAEIAARET